MYLTQARLSDVRGVSRADLGLRYPGEIVGETTVELDNLNVLLGLNGGGKSTVLKSMAAAATGNAAAVDEGWLRRGCDADLNAEVEVVGDDDDRGPYIDRRQITFRRGDDLARSNRSVDATESSWVFCGYGADRAPAPTARPSDVDRSATGLGSLLSDEPLPPLAPEELTETEVRTVNYLLPADTGIRTDAAGNRSFVQRQLAVEEWMLSDGLRNFLCWVGDLLRRISSAGFDDPAEARGVVLVDEIDQRMHPRWQQYVLAQLSSTFPHLQFIVAAHSPLVAASLRPANLILMESAPDDDAGATVASRLTEDLFDRSVDQVLESSYFGLDSPRGGLYRTQLKQRAVAARSGDPAAALDYMSFLAGSTSPTEERPRAGAGPWHRIGRIWRSLFRRDAPPPSPSPTT